MLRKVILYNFVCFRGEIIFKFAEGGVYFFFGGNSTGKTAVLEAIRNCLKTTDLKLASSPCNPHKYSFAVSYFHTDICKIASIYMYNFAKDRILKVLAVTDKNNRSMQIFGAGRIHNDWKVWRIPLDGSLPEDLNRIKESTEEVFKCMDRADDTSVMEHVLDLYNCLTPKKLKKYKTETSLFDDFIQQYISIEMTLPHRGINPAQSTYADPNQFQASSENADVLKWYLERDNDGEGESLLHIFQQLSYGSEYPLDNENGTIEMTNENTGKKMPLLRLPEAVVEGHVASILLCGATPTTLCLEEPNRGMDRQTTKLLCHVLKQKDCKKKLVIVATHEPLFISPLSLPKSYIFSGKMDECIVFNGKTLCSSIDEKVKRFVTSYPVSLILFSKRVFIVEGASDLLFVEAIRDVVLQNSNDVGGHLLERARLRKDLYLRHLQHFLSSLTIISLDGEGNKKKTEKLCEFLDMKGDHGRPVSRYYLLDYEKVYEDIKKKLDLMITSLYPSFTELAEKGVFIWSSDLEMEVATFCHAQQLGDLLRRNNVPIRRVRRKRGAFRIRNWESTKKDGKLFLESPNLTERNRHEIVSGILNAIDLDKEGEKEHKKGGTVPMFLKFIIIAMLESIGQGDKLKWDGETYFA